MAASIRVVFVLEATGSSRFVLVGAAASGGVVGADDLGDAAEMQLDGILDMLDKWEQFETPDGEMPDGDLCELG